MTTNVRSPRAEAEAFEDSRCYRKYRRPKAWRRIREAAAAGQSFRPPVEGVVYHSEVPFPAAVHDLVPDDLGFPSLTVFGRDAAQELGRECAGTTSTFVLVGPEEYEVAAVAVHVTREVAEELLHRLVQLLGLEAGSLILA